MLPCVVKVATGGFFHVILFRDVGDTYIMCMCVVVCMLNIALVLRISH
jgi:hypothetical protein